MTLTLKTQIPVPVYQGLYVQLKYACTVCDSWLIDHDLKDQFISLVHAQLPRCVHDILEHYALNVGFFPPAELCPGVECRLSGAKIPGAHHGCVVRQSTHSPGSSAVTASIWTDSGDNEGHIAPLRHILLVCARHASGGHVQGACQSANKQSSTSNTVQGGFSLCAVSYPPSEVIGHVKGCAS